MLKIGSLELPSSLMLAPMAGISDLPFRMINREFGCAFALTEMISSHSLVYQSKKTEKMLMTSETDRPLGIQLLGNDADILNRAIGSICISRYDLIDFNAACPVQKVISKGKGASLMNDPRKLANLLSVIVKNSDIPVTVKMRAGWDKDSVNAREVALHVQDTGISGLCIHGRTREQGYSGHVDYKVIAEVKKAVRIPVIASGDALSPELIKKMFDETGCDGVSIARGSLGNPWIFREATALINHGEALQKTCVDEIIKTMKKHLDMCCNFYDEKEGTVRFRKYFSWYIRGLAGARQIKDKAFHAESRNEMLGLMHVLEEMHHCGSIRKEACSVS